MMRVTRAPWARRALALSSACCAAAVGALVAAPAAAGETPPPIPAAAPPAAFLDEPALPAADAWAFSEEFSRTAGTSRYVDGALLWTDWLFDDTGDGSFTYADEAAHANGADVFRAGVGAHGRSSSWRVDFTTLADPDLPLAVWALDTDADPSTGTSAWPGGAGLTSPGVDAFLIVSSRGAVLETADGERRDLVRRGAVVTVDEEAGSFVVEIPRALLRINGRWTVRLATGIADGTGFGFAAPPERNDVRAYNAAFRTGAQEGERLPGAKMATSWNNGAQSRSLATGDVAPFAIEVDWRRIARGETQAEPAPRGFSTRWYVSSVDLGPGVHPEVREPLGQPPTTAPRVYGRVQPYLLYVPTTYDAASPAPLTILLHGGSNNHNGFRGGQEDELFGPVCEDRGSICVSPLGRGDGTWYVNEAELDVWEVWNRVSEEYAIDGTRTVIAGHSMGGVGATRFAVNHPDVFAAVGIVSGAGYRNAGGGRDDAEDPLRVENLANMTVFMDAGTDDIAEGNTRTWGAAFEAAGVAHRVHYYGGATHGDFGWLGWRELAAHVDGATVTTDPARVAFRWDPTEERSELGLTIDSAAWVSELAPRDPEARWSRVEARSAALDTVRWEPVVGTETVAYGDHETEVRELALVPIGAHDPADELDLAFTNVATAAVDLDVAGLSDAESITVRVTTDGAVELRLRHGDGTHVTSVAAGEHVLTVELD
ncbi:alpha/beta hydrolase-fold protein [Microbacterium sp. Marseille-Q6965]|uniref:alpha/beta hydrolase-fold protein n=1 Tax=Microbacterium sp. Marseille-Q6965 TaxID=2965072 RepID=UPI0021B73795|nr:alpha/beta hydrolase-fold protein [Microbacterium sp. Marseille-Q6965]